MLLLQQRGPGKALISPIAHCRGFPLSPECNPGSFPGTTGPAGPGPACLLNFSCSTWPVRDAPGGCLSVPGMLKLSPPQDSALAVPSTQNSLPPSLHTHISVIHIYLDSVTSACLPVYPAANLPSAQASQLYPCLTFFTAVSSIGF